ncbi:suppressor of fused domain protein [Methanolapillus millepedarum]|uniref:Suppressor of fused-like domain-containing protein n=1 Tax=Methanolapillus millepedarum TaxID=3028296 RepID=A0AA96V3R8_9EURY|nr:hypothetical protein MsAc7_15940 [Methanosarcinaceae archaeon Ac7]
MNAEESFISNENPDRTVLDHLKRFYDEKDIGRIEKTEDLIHVYVVKANRERPYHLLITAGMSRIQMDVPPGFEDFRFSEVMMLLPEYWPLFADELEKEENNWPIQVLQTIAKLPVPDGTWVSWGHTVSNKDAPFSRFVSVESSLLVYSITVPEEFVKIELPEKVIHIYSAIPLYPEELEFKIKYGAENLLDKFNRYQIPEILDCDRENVCNPRHLRF